MTLVGGWRGCQGNTSRETGVAASDRENEMKMLIVCTYPDDMTCRMCHAFRVMDPGVVKLCEVLQHPHSYFQFRSIPYMDYYISLQRAASPLTSSFFVLGRSNTTGYQDSAGSIAIENFAFYVIMKQPFGLSSSARVWGRLAPRQAELMILILRS